jgi:predicted Zn-dependent protease
MNKLTLVAFSLVIGIAATAQTLQDAIKKTDNERYDLARNDFKNLVKANPTSVENTFFLGNFYLTIGEKDSAIAEWKRAGSLNLEDKLAQISAAKAIYFAGDSAAANKLFCGIIKATKSKNAMVFHRIAEVYFTAPLQNLHAAEAMLRKSVALNSTNIDALILLGDVLLAQSGSNATTATEQYNKALAINPNAANVIVRKAKIYQGVGNYNLANQEYQKAQAADPTYAPAYRLNAELNILFDRYNPAIELWKKYIALNDSQEARYRYATSIFGAKKYCDALPELESLKAGGFENLFTKRMYCYSLYECNDDNNQEKYKNALATSDAFFQIVPAEKIIALDYKYRGMILTKLGQDSLAILAYSQAVAKDTANAFEYNGMIAKLYFKAKNNEKSIEYYNLKEQQAPEKMDVNDFFELGRAYYFAKTPNYIFADSCFAKVNRLAPSFIGAYLWRARANNKLEDPKLKAWKAKEYYEGYLTHLTEKDLANPSQKTNIIEASKYLGDYYVNSAEKNKEKANENWNRVKALEPNDAQAKAYFASGLGK